MKYPHSLLLFILDNQNYYLIMFYSINFNTVYLYLSIFKIKNKKIPKDLKIYIKTFMKKFVKNI